MTEFFAYLFFWRRNTFRKRTDFIFILFIFHYMNRSDVLLLEQKQVPGKYDFWHTCIIVFPWKKNDFSLKLKNMKNIIFSKSKSTKTTKTGAIQMWQMKVGFMESCRIRQLGKLISLCTVIEIIILIIFGFFSSLRSPIYTRQITFLFCFRYPSSGMPFFVLFIYIIIFPCRRMQYKNQMQCLVRWI